MVSTRLLQRIEQHWDAIARSVVEQTRTDPHTPHHQVLDDEEVRARARGLVHDLNLWLDNGDEATLAGRYKALGKARHAEGVSLAEVVYKLLLIERKTADYIQSESIAQSSVDMWGELEMIRALDRFFGIVLHSVVAGYEESAIATRAAAWARHTTA